MTQDNKHNKWLEILDFQPKHLWRTPTKIHRERRRQRQQEAACKAQTTLLSPAKATSSTQWRKILQLRDKWSRWRERTPTCRRFKKRWGPRWSQTSLPRKLILNLPILSGVRNFKWAFQVTLHFSSLVLLYSTPAFLLARVQPLSKLIQIFNFGIFIYWDVVQKREQKRPYLNHLGKTYNCFCNALISSHRILGVLAEERHHRSFTDSTLHTGVFTVNH